jgi:hypothetical protein
MACFILLACAAAAGPGPARAEVSAEPGPIEVSVAVLGIIEGPDPIPQEIWAPVRDIAPARYLNTSGAERGDGRPDIAIDPATGWPHVVWAYHNGTDFDIAYSCWDGEGWTETQLLASSALDEKDPRIHARNGRIHVVWWVEQTRAVWLLVQPRPGQWDVPERVDAMSGMRPSVVAGDADVLVACEADADDGGRRILVSERQGEDLFDVEVVASTPGHRPLDVVLHAEQGRLWMDWKHSATQFAYAELTGKGWGPATTLPWTDQSWSGTEEARRVVRSLVLGSF